MSFTEQNISLWGEDIPWLSGLRQKGRQAFTHCGWPTAKNEAWKYTAFSPEKLHNPQIIHENRHCSADCHCRHNHSPFPFKVYTVEFCNGQLHDENFADDLPQGITIKSLAEAIYDGEAQKYLGKSFAMENFPFAALNTAYIEQGVMILVEKNHQLDAPLYVHYHVHDEADCFCNIRNLIILESNASATIIEHYEADKNAAYFTNAVNEIFLNNSANLQHYTWQNEALEAHHVALNSVQLRTDSSYNSFILQNECATSRHESFINLQQRGAAAEVNGVYRLQNNGVSDITTNIRHLAESTYSNQLVKGVVNGQAKGVFQGQIHIAPDAINTEGHQLHRALLLSNSAEIDCKPELEIFADDVQCSHGATCGDLDPEQMFYMQTRGIDENTARQLLITAHLQEVIEKIPQQNIKDWFLQLI